MSLRQAYKSVISSIPIPPKVVDEHIVRHITLDELWVIAEKLGKIEVDHSWSNRDHYRVRIQFKRPSGSTVWAEGTDQSILFAFQKAIAEARGLQ